jgi:hypothetical protein
MHVSILTFYELMQPVGVLLVKVSKFISTMIASRLSMPTMMSGLRRSPAPYIPDESACTCLYDGVSIALAHYCKWSLEQVTTTDE